MSAEKVVATVSKPQLRGLLHSQIKKNLIISIGLALASGVALKVFMGDARKRRYAEFYRTYDAEKDFHRMKAAGVFQSC